MKKLVCKVFFQKISDIKFHFACYEWNLYQDFVKFLNIMHLIIVGKVNNDISIGKRQKRENRMNREERGGSSKFF